jgi:hypothetical protein
MIAVGQPCQSVLAAELTRYHRDQNRSASAKSFLRPPGDRLDCAGARWSEPASRGAPLRTRRLGRQCCSSASHTGRQYCAVVGAESVPRRINQGRELSPRENTATLNYSVNHARSGSNSCSASLAPWLISTSPLPARPFCTRDDFHAFRGPQGPAATSCGNRPVRRANSPKASWAPHVVFGNRNSSLTLGVSGSESYLRSQIPRCARSLGTLASFQASNDSRCSSFSPRIQPEEPTVSGSFRTHG